MLFVKGLLASFVATKLCTFFVNTKHFYKYFLCLHFCMTKKNTHLKKHTHINIKAKIHNTCTPLK